MKLGLINSAWVQAGRGTSYGIRKTREIGFDSIDICADPLDISDQEYSPDPQHIVEWVVEAHDKTAALLRAAGLRP